MQTEAKEAWERHARSETPGRKCAIVFAAARVVDAAVLFGTSRVHDLGCHELGEGVDKHAADAACKVDGFENLAVSTAFAVIVVIVGGFVRERTTS